MIYRFYALTKLFLAKDNRIETLLVIGFDPSHSNVNNGKLSSLTNHHETILIDVYAPFKILSIMIRCLHNELSQHLRAPGEDYYKSLRPNNANKYGDNGARVETIDDDDFDMERDMMDDEPDAGIEVDLEKQKDEDEEIDIQKRFNVFKTLFLNQLFNTKIFFRCRKTKEKGSQE